MSKSDERAAKARSLILSGMDRADAARQAGYQSVAGMMGAISMLEHKEKTKSLSNKQIRAMQSFEPYTGPVTKRQEKRQNQRKEEPSPEPEGIRVDVQRNNGLYARMEGRHLIISYIGYRRSLNIMAKHVPGREIRLYDTELGGSGTLQQALREMHEMTGRLLELIEGK